MTKITVIVDPSLCISAANCVGIAPKLFQIGSEPYVELLDRSGKPQGPELTVSLSDAELALIEEAMESCPTRAIRCER
jgi:ferredoxin